MKVSKSFFILDVLLPLVVVTIALACIVFSFPIIHQILDVSSDYWRAKGVEGILFLGDALLITSIALFSSFLVIRIAAVYYRFRLRSSLSNATEAGSDQLTEIRERLDEVLEVLRPSRRRR